MKTKKIAEDYADALFKLTLIEGIVDEVEKDLYKIESMIRTQLKLKEIWENTGIIKEKKKAIFEEILKKEKVNPIVTNFLNLLIDAGREKAFFEVAKEFSKMISSRRKKVLVEVTTAFPLKENELLKVKRKLKEIIKKEIVLKTSVNENILGGIIIRIGDKLIDASLRKRLDKLKESILVQK